MIMEVLYMIALLLVGAVVVGGIVGWAVLKELQRMHLLIFETVNNTQVITASIPQQDFRELMSQLPDVGPWTEDRRLEETDA